jgi:predicted translation initiation factor SUI1
MARTRNRTVLFLGGQAAATIAASFDETAVKMGMPWRAQQQEVGQVSEADLAEAVVVVAPNEAECRPVLQERFPAWVDRVRYLHSASSERAVTGLIAVLLGGTAEAPESPPAPEPAKKKPAERPTVRVGRETKGRRGKGVTTVSDLPLNAEEIAQLAARLKQNCGSGGTVRDGVIEIQGDHRDRLVGELEALGYRVKRAGG